jgi:hypothetical protein
VGEEWAEEGCEAEEQGKWHDAHAGFGFESNFNLALSQKSSRAKGFPGGPPLDG